MKWFNSKSQINHLTERIDALEGQVSRLRATLAERTEFRVGEFPSYINPTLYWRDPRAVITVVEAIKKITHRMDLEFTEVSPVPADVKLQRKPKAK